MAFHHPYLHQQNHSTSATSFCCCQPSPLCHHPPLPLPPQPLPATTTTTTDPFIVAAIVTQILQSPNPQHLYSQYLKPTSLNLSKSENGRHPHQESHQLDPHSGLSSLLQRIDALEASLQRFSSGSLPFSSLRDAAARIIQAHYRAHLVHRSRTLGQLQELASIKSALASLNSSLSCNRFPDFDFLSHKAMDLLRKLDTIQSGNKMIKDSKKSVTREIAEFLELIDGVCVKRHQLLTRKVKNLRLMRNNNSMGYVAPKGGDVRGGEEKKLIANLRERVEKIGIMSKALEQEQVLGNAEIKGFNHGGDDDIIDQINCNYRLKNGLNTKKNAQSSNAKKSVCFLEDGNVIRFFDVDGGSKSGSRLVEVIEDTDKGANEEEEAQSDGDGSSHSSEEIRKCTSEEVSEECDNQDEFTFSTTKVDPRADFMSRKSGFKIVG